MSIFINYAIILPNSLDTMKCDVRLAHYNRYRLQYYAYVNKAHKLIGIAYRLYRYMQSINIRHVFAPNIES